MEHLRRFLRICGLILCFFSLTISIHAEEDNKRIKPLDLAVQMADMEEPLSLDTFIDGAFLFSGTHKSNLKREKRRLYAFISQAYKTVEAMDNPKEKAEQLLKAMHENILTGYREKQTRLDLLIQEGSHNCVSSAILYTILVKSIGMKVWGIRTPDHAFCRVQAGEQAFDVETTSPYGFDPGSKKEFKDHFGQVTGYSYVPPTNYRGRKEIDEKGLLSLILYNRQAFLSERKAYAEAIGPAADAYALLNDNESYDRLIVSYLNLGSWYSLRQEHQQAFSFISTVSKEFRQEIRLMKLGKDLLHNWIVSLIDRGQINEAEKLLESQIQSDEMEKGEWRILMIYIFQVKAREAAKKDFKQAAMLIEDVLCKIGRDPGLLKSYEVYIHNQVVKLIRSGRYEDALLVLNKAFTIIPNSRLLLKDQSIIISQIDSQ